MPFILIFLVVARFYFCDACFQNRNKLTGDVCRKPQRLSNFRFFTVQLIWGLVVQTQHQCIVAVYGTDILANEWVGLDDFAILFHYNPHNAC